MIERFKGNSGYQILIDALRDQRIVRGDSDLAQQIAAVGELVEVKAGETLIEQGAHDTDIYLIVAGVFDILVNATKVATRGPGDHIGEMSAIQPSQSRSATAVASEVSVLCKLTEPQLSALAESQPQIWRSLARELARRLDQRNALVSRARDKVQVFMISSSEALPVARAVHSAFEFDPFNVTVWPDGVFRASWYPVESLEEQLDVSDFAIAIAQPDDVTESRGQSAASARDNVIFELGMFIGRLGRKRSLLLEPRGEEVKLPPDLSGITTISYRHATGRDLASAIAPACNRIREIIADLGPHD